MEEVYAYSFGSVGFVRFTTTNAMFLFLKQAGAKEKPQIGDRNLWISSSKSPEERKKSKTLSKFKKVLLDTKLAKPEDVKVDYKRGIVFVSRLRVAEWKNSADTESTDNLVIDQNAMQQVGIDVEPKKIYDAGAELLRN
jgi:hypothetical protein